MLYNVNHMAKPEMNLGEFEQMVLLALVRLGPDAYGATIRREIEARTGRELAISAVYVTLDRLETKGLVKSRVGDPSPTRGGRRRQAFRLRPPPPPPRAAADRTYPCLDDGHGREMTDRRPPA